jgi:hypothetical protein
VLGFPLEFHECTSKCGDVKSPCVGPHCYCDGYEPPEYAHCEPGLPCEPELIPAPEALCLAPSLCYEACEQVASCVGVSVNIKKNRCILAAAVDLARDNDHDFFMRRTGLPCTDAEDFESIESTVAVTSRVHLRRGSWIVGSGPRRPDCRDDPHRDDLEDLSFSLEIPGNRLDWRKDRMMVLDCSTACGDPDGLPTELVTKPRFRSLEYPSVETFNNFVAYASTVDKPSNDNEMVDYQVYYPATYGRITSSFCPGRNYARQKLHHYAADLCYKKCVVEAPCEGDHCYCEGLNFAHDGRDSDALCLPQEICQSVCDRLDSCVGIDMHSDRPRCYLNLAGWANEDEMQFEKNAEDWGRCDYGVLYHKLGYDPEYDFLFKFSQELKNALRDHANPPDYTKVYRELQEERTDRRLQVKEDPKECIDGVLEGDNGYSWGKLLRFLPIQFSAGGRFRLCFCDNTLTADGECKSAEDYDLDLGYVMASGVTCFLDQARYKRDMHCISMYHGGQRCYSTPLEAPDLGVPRQQTLREVNYKKLASGTFISSGDNSQLGR